MSRAHPDPAESFGQWLIDRVQENTGQACIFSGDENRVLHIRNQFHIHTGTLVAWILEQEKKRRDETERS